MTENNDHRNNAHNMPPFTPDSTYQFLCHPGVPCFTDCCQNITIFLTPHDVLRMKNALKIDSAELLATYTTIFYRENSPFPFVQLKMTDQPALPCPFVAPETGCQIYADRPWACRMYPLDLADENHYTLVVDHHKCKGLLEKREWLISEWLQNQGIEDFDELDFLYASLTSSQQIAAEKSNDPRIREMIVMAAYDLDRFRDFVFNSNFFNKFDLPEEEIELVKTDDRELLKLGFKWLGFGLISPMSLRIKQTIIEEFFKDK